MTDNASFLVSQPLDEQTAYLLEQLLGIARSSALEEMASGIAHELNQPIGAIATFAQTAERMLQRHPPMVSEAIGVLRHITNEAMGAGQGIHRIRKLFNDRQAAREMCSLADVLNQLLPVMRLLANRAAIELIVDVQPDLPQVSIDRLRIQHVLFTLLQNALEVPARSEGAKVMVTVRADRYEVRTRIEDQGTGLSPEVRAQLFRAFFTTKRNGTGLGLASSRAIIEAHQGSIGADEASDGGACFWFTLPAAPESSPR